MHVSGGRGGGWKVLMATLLHCCMWIKEDLPFQPDTPCWCRGHRRWTWRRYWSQSPPGSLAWSCFSATATTKMPQRSTGTKQRQQNYRKQTNVTTINRSRQTGTEQIYLAIWIRSPTFMFLHYKCPAKTTTGTSWDHLVSQSTPSSTQLVQIPRILSCKAS